MGRMFEDERGARGVVEYGGVVLRYMLQVGLSALTPWGCGVTGCVTPLLHPFPLHRVTSLRGKGLWDR